jgi:nucleoside 2-deoxyribosyltransferase
VEAVAGGGEVKIYVASSWRNNTQAEVVQALREAGHEVYDFKNPAPGNNGFHWSEIDRDWQQWTPEQFREALCHPVADSGYSLDWGAMQWSDAGVMVLPCGRSAHIEAGYFVGAGKPLIILLAPGEPELMYKMATAICLTVDEVIRTLKEAEANTEVWQYARRFQATGVTR